uniref:Uncharacterized protein n=1 Tax=Rhizophora mucronata TaxID=61149 RepID=A0A2P2R4D3_RHIMU
MDSAVSEPVVHMAVRHGQVRLRLSDSWLSIAE